MMLWVLTEELRLHAAKTPLTRKERANSWDAIHGGARQVLKPLGKLNEVYALSNLSLFSNAFLGG